MRGTKGKGEGSFRMCKPTPNNQEQEGGKGSSRAHEEARAPEARALEARAAQGLM